MSFRPSPAMVVAVIALVLALGGGAVAAIPGPDGSIVGCVGARGALRAVDTPSQCEAGEQAVTWNQAGRTGPQGSQGPQGAPGQRGAPGGSSSDTLNRLVTGRSSAPQALTKKPKPLPGRTAQKLTSQTSPDSEARSRFRDGGVALNSILGPIVGLSGEQATVLRLALPKGRWVMQAKTEAAYVGDVQLGQAQEADVLRGAAYCSLVAEQEVDIASAIRAALSLQVVHRFAKPGAVELRCIGGFNSVLYRSKVTAIKVAKLTNGPGAP